MNLIRGQITSQVDGVKITKKMSQDHKENADSGLKRWGLNYRFRAFYLWMIGDAVRVAEITTKSYLNMQNTRVSGEHLGLKGALPRRSH